MQMAKAMPFCHATSPIHDRAGQIDLGLERLAV